jgi:AraC family transcriptional regulator
MMDGGYRTTAALSLAQLQLERVTQEGSGPFERAHELEQPSLVYVPPGRELVALGCFGAPRSHRSFTPFGAAVVVPAHVPLHVRSPGFAEREMIVIRFDEARFGDLTGISAASAASELAACADVRAAAVIDLLERLSTELSRTATARETIVAGLGLLVMGELARHFERVRDGAFGRRGMLADWQIRRIEARLDEEDRPLPGIDELASACGIGRRHLMRAYKASTGTTVMDRVERTLFQRATRMLAEDRRPVKAIAGALGYESQGSFATAFRRRFGETPSGWRARRRGAG